MQISARNALHPQYRGEERAGASPIWRIFGVARALLAVANFGERFFHELR